MKRILITLSLLLPLAALASFVVVFNQVSKRVTGTIASANTLEYTGDGYLINPVVPDGMLTNLNRFWVTNGIIEAVPQSVLDAEAAAAAAAQVLAVAVNRTNIINAASSFADGTNIEQRIIRAFALLTLDQVNTLRKLQSLVIITTNQFLIGLSNTVKADIR